MFEYTEAEVKLIKSVSPHWANVITKCEINPTNLYRILAEEAFTDNLQGPSIEALRRVCKAIRSCKIYRHTPEFDALCEF